MASFIFSDPRVSHQPSFPSYFIDRVIHAGPMGQQGKRVYNTGRRVGEGMYHGIQGNRKFNKEDNIGQIRRKKRGYRLV